MNIIHLCPDVRHLVGQSVYLSADFSWLKEIMGGLNIHVLLLISFFAKANASIDTRNEELMTTTTQPPNGLVDDSMSDFNLKQDEEETLNNKPSLQSIIEWFCFAFIMALLVIFILCTFVALFLKIRAYVKKKFNK